MMRKILQLLAILLIAGSGLYAQQFNATVDKTVVGQNERFQVYFTLSCPDMNKASNFKAPSFGGLKILSGPNQSTSMQIINGKMDASVTLSYLVFAPETGETSIGAATISYDGKTYTTKPIKIKVEKSSAQPQQQQSGASLKSAKEIAKNLFIIAEADKKSACVGEQVTVTYKLYTKVNIASPQITKLPVFQGFWTEEVDIKNINFDVAMYNNERFRVAVIKKAALFPTKTGSLTVSSFELKIPVQVPKKKSGNDIFDEFFNDPFFGRNETVEFTAKSNALQINVNQLPQQGAPAGFNGTVGSFTITSEIDKKALKTNESATIRLTITGTGNMKLISPPEIKVPSGFEKYEPKVAENINRTVTIGGQKVIDYLIIPRTPGDYEIPPIEFSFYNPHEKKYVTLKTNAFKLKVEKGEGYVENSNANYSKENVQLLNEDIRYIKSSNYTLAKKSDFSTIKWWFWAGLVLFAALFTAIVILSKRREKLYSNTRLLKFRKAEKVAVKKLEMAKNAIAKNDAAGFYEELSKAIFGYLEDKLSIDKSDFTHEKVISELSVAGVNEEMVSKVKELTELCEFARFAPQAEGLKGKTEVYGEAVALITALESSFDTRKKK
jgi:hypothetical protein